jgi:ribokinase
MTTILNPAPAPALSQTETTSLLSLAHVITPNRLEAQVLSGLLGQADNTAGWTNHASRLRSLGPRTVIITLGSHGSLLFENEPQVIPTTPVTAIDTVGAGDAFNGALAIALLEKTMCMADCVRWANAAAALAVTTPGAQSALPSRHEIDTVAKTMKHRLVEN